jgi:hypothetical protein
MTHHRKAPTTATTPRKMTSHIAPTVAVAEDRFPTGQEELNARCSAITLDPQLPPVDHNSG